MFPLSWTHTQYIYIHTTIFSFTEFIDCCVCTVSVTDHWEVCVCRRACVTSQDPQSTELLVTLPNKMSTNTSFQQVLNKACCFSFSFSSNNPINQWYYCFGFLAAVTSTLFLHFSFHSSSLWIFSLRFSSSVQLRPWLHVGSSPSGPQHLYCPGRSSSCWARVLELQPLPRWLLEVCPGSQATTTSALR